MADAKIVDINGVQWELKDEVARNNILELKNKDEKIIASIDSIKNKHFPNYIGHLINYYGTQKWYKLSNLYNGIPYNNNIFLLTARQGEVIELICPIEDNNVPFEPIVIRHTTALNRIKKFCFKNGDIYVLGGIYNSIRINQISGVKCDASIAEEDPPTDATDIKINEIQLV